MKNLFKKTENSSSHKTDKKAFTLIETMVAITILLLAIVGPMQIAANSLFAAFYARDEITAYYLAQEGIEYLRNDRDMYFGNNTSGWPVEFSSCEVSATNVGCKVDLYQLTTTPPGTVVTACGNSSGASSCGHLNYNSQNGFYSYDSSTGNSPSKFTRTITITPDYEDDSTNDAVLVSSTISWSGGELYGATKTFTISEVLYDWQIKGI